MSSTIPKEPLRTLFAALTGLPTSRVLWDGEPKGFAGRTASGKTGHLVLNVTATRVMGIDEELREYGVTHDDDPDPKPTYVRITNQGHRVRTISVRTESYGNYEGCDFLEDLRLQLGQDDTCAALNDTGLALNSVENVQNLGGVEGNRAVSFAVLDVLVNQMVSRTRDVLESTGDTYINEVEVEGQDDLALAGTDDIGPPPSE